MNRILLQRLLWIVLLLAALPSMAAIEELSFADETQRARYQTLIDELRCPMCLNSNLSGSDAPIAADLRAEIHRQILEGKSDEEILEFLVDRYGEFILYRPRLHIGTAVLWFGPPLLLLGGFFILRRMLVSNRQRSGEGDELSQSEQQQLRDLLASEKQTHQPDAAKAGK
jgi:cytochrome c-type biogenesis protein CcmH